MRYNRIMLFAAVLLAPVLLSASCERKDCTGNTICTDLFAMVGVQVVDNNNQPVALDSAYTVRGSNNEQIRPQQEMQNGYYTVLDDNYRAKLVNTSDSFRFRGFRNGQRLVDELYVIGGDCCHISRISGRDRVVLP